VLSRYYEEAATSPDAATAVRRCLEHVILPVQIAGLTTIVGFGALLISDVPAVFELGAFAMLGVASATLIVSTGVPALLVLLPLRAAPAVEVQQGVSPSRATRLAARLDRSLSRWLARVAAWVARSPRRVIRAGAASALCAAVALPFIVIDTDYLSYFDEHEPIRLDFDAVNRLLAGAIPLYVTLDGPQGQGEFREPEALRVLTELQERFDRIAGVSRTLSFVDSIRVLNRAFQAGDPREERIPDTRAAVSELLFLVPKSELQPFATVNHDKANLIVRTGEVGSAAIQALYDALEGAIGATPLPPGVEARVTGNAVLLARSADGIARGQPQSVALAAIAIFVLIAVGLRSPRLGAVAMIPNLVPVLVFFGLLGLGAAPLSLPTSLIGCIALGVAIDDTVHFLVRYRAERQGGASPEEAALRCGRHVGRPIAVTSIVLVAGLLVIAFSDFATLREFGILAAATMGICLLNDLVLLPALLLRFRV
jgi:predicted RND superfamily exporter protein